LGDLDDADAGRRPASQDSPGPRGDGRPVDADSPATSNRRAGPEGSQAEHGRLVHSLMAGPGPGRLLPLVTPPGGSRLPRHWSKLEVRARKEVQDAVGTQAAATPRLDRIRAVLRGATVAGSGVRGLAWLSPSPGSDPGKHEGHEGPSASARDG